MSKSGGVVWFVSATSRPLAVISLLRRARLLSVYTESLFRISVFYYAQLVHVFLFTNTPYIVVAIALCFDLLECFLFFVLLFSGIWMHLCWPFLLWSLKLIWFNLVTAKLLTMKYEYESHRGLKVGIYWRPSAAYYAWELINYVINDNLAYNSFIFIWQLRCLQNILLPSEFAHHKERTLVILRE